MAARSSVKRIAPAVAFLGIGLLVPVVTSNVYYLSVATLICIYAALAQAWNLLMGVAGIWSFGQVALFAVGAYGNVLLGLKAGLPPALAFLGGGLLAMVAGILVALPAVRLRGIYVVLFTLSLQQIMSVLITTDTSGFTGGSQGLFGYDGFGLNTMSFALKAQTLYLIAFVLLVVSAVIVYRVMRSPMGLGFKSLRDAESYSVGRGVGRTASQVVVFAITAFLSGLAGAVYSMYVGTITPSVLGFDTVALLLTIIVIGGWGTFYGPLLGAIVVIVVSERLHDIETWRTLTLSLWTVLMIVLLPGGLVGLVTGRPGSPRRLGTMRPREKALDRAITP